MNSKQSVAQLATAAIVAAVFSACGPGEVDDRGSDPEPDLPDEAEEGVVGDPWNCGELGLKCIGALAIGECIDGECQGRLIGQCWSPEFAPSCDAFCESFGESCVYLGCEGATAYGWTGLQAEADGACSVGHRDSVIPMTVTCDQPLEGLITTVLCCCT